MTKKFTGWVRPTLILALAFSACVHPTPPAPVSDAAPPAPADVFTGKIFDCTGLDTSMAAPLAGTCGDTGGVAACMVMYFNQGTSPTSLACAARDVQVAAFIEISRGTAGPETKARAAALRAWLLAEHIQLRN